MSTKEPAWSAEDRFSRSASAAYVSSRWCCLPPHIRETIVTLVDAGLQTHPIYKHGREETAKEGFTEGSTDK